MSELYSYPTNDYRSYLEHHGVKGMKWGVRRERYEAKRKAKYMKKYGVTSKQYDSVREKSLGRQARAEKFRKTYNKVGIALTAPLMAAATISAAKQNGLSKGETAMALAPAAIGGIAGYKIGEAIQRVEWNLGYRIIDSIVESADFERMKGKK